MSTADNRTDKLDATTPDRPHDNTMGGNGPGWRELREDRETTAPAQDRRSNSAKSDSLRPGAIELEETETRRSGPSKSADPERAAGGEDGASVGVAVAGVREYKVYKRRWFGLVQLTLLNIIVSWDVSTACPRQVATGLRMHLRAAAALRRDYWSSS